MVHIKSDKLDSKQVTIRQLPNLKIDGMIRRKLMKPSRSFTSVQK